MDLKPTLEQASHFLSLDYETNLVAESRICLSHVL